MKKEMLEAFASNARRPADGARLSLSGRFAGAGMRPAQAQHVVDPPSFRPAYEAEPVMGAAADRRHRTDG